MLTKDIIINGVSLLQLEAQQAAVQEGAEKLILEQVELAESLAEKILASKNSKEVKQLAKEAYDALSTAQSVSYITGINFDLSFYNINDETFSEMLSESKNKAVVKNWDNGVRKLCGLFEDMEIQCDKWNR